MVREEKPEVSRELVLQRLKKIEGQIRGLQKMVADERDCESIVTQLGGALAVRELMAFIPVKRSPYSLSSVLRVIQAVFQPSV